MMGTDRRADADPQRVWVLPVDEAVDPPSQDVIGGKAWSLWRMRRLGMRVPPAFVVSTAACRAYFEGPEALPPGLVSELRAGVERLERELGRGFGSVTHPLLVSVRSGAAVSMPGMMDTILNLGVNPEVEVALATETGSAGFAAEIHRRFCAFYGSLVLGCTEELDASPSASSAQAMIRESTGLDVPTDPWDQLEAAVAAVFSSSRSRRATAYRRHHGIPQDLGTAVTVQAMVFGNLDDSSGTGVLFSRNPLSGEAEVYGEYLPGGQGEDVVSGRVTPRSLQYLAERAPAVHEELVAAARRLDEAGRDAQDIEFTVQSGVLYLLQSRPAKRTARAAVHIAAELALAGTITPDEALARVTPEQVSTLLRAEVAESATLTATLLASGVTASPGAASGMAVATSEEAEQHPGSILVRPTTSPEDVQGMIAAAAVVTETGGATSHAAVVSRALDTPCVVGCGPGTAAALVGRMVTVHATTGRIYAGALAMAEVDESDDPDLRQIAEWARSRSALGVVSSERDAPDPLWCSDEEEAGATPDIPAGTRSVKGRVFATRPGAAAALAAGVETVVARHELPVLLAAATEGGRAR